MTSLISSQNNVSLESNSILVSELLQGRDSASQLKLLLQNPSSPDGPHSAQHLLAKILRSFTQTISLLTSPQAAAPNLAISAENGSPAGASGESRKKSSPATKDRRGCYKRRKTAHTWTHVSNTLDDNHAWRKYGQKHILNSEYPRSYFRCTRKNEQGCKAIKQVQQIQENPERFQTTYIGTHTCKDMNLKPPEVVKDFAGNWESYINVSESESKVQNDEVMMMHDNLMTSGSSSSTPSIKQEYHPKELDTPLSGVTDNNLDPCDDDLWSDLKDIELPQPSIMLSNNHNADDIYCGVFM
ncbi:putative WRKY transcription factor 70 [Senna tora]|uniref:Putative WRKY transcription factor 70 n=1 Tax=Senna tora TaxID=362788 RepID=A0A834T768_9FABA|nr:putative WRKY transcription factor 70 [Senna tora]